MRNWILVAAVVGGACGGNINGPDAVKLYFPPDEGMHIEAVELRVVETTPRLVVAHVRGVFDGCSSPGSIEQSPFRNGVSVLITVRRMQETDCNRQASRIYEQDIPLVGPYGSGTFTVRVNLMTRTIEL